MSVARRSIRRRSPADSRAATVVTTARGAYLLKIAEAPDRRGDSLAVTFTLERADGIERVALRCVIADALLPDASRDAIAFASRRIAAWLEREFEQVREAALRSVRAEHRLLEFVFDHSNPGPFTR